MRCPYRRPSINEWIMCMQTPIIWVHADCLSPRGPAFAANPDAAAIFVFDEALLQEYQISSKRLMFMYECLLELPVVIRRGDVAAEVLRFADQHGADGVVTTASVAPRFADIQQQIARTHPVQALPVDPFVEYPGRLDLKRFSRYWSKVEAYAFGQKPLFD